MLRVPSSLGWLFSLPALLGLLLFVALPFLLAVALSVTNYRLGSPLPLKWVGFEHYGRLLTDATFLRALVNNALFAMIIVPLQTTLALVLAVALNKALVGVTALRAVFFTPVVFPLSLVAVIWILLYAPGDTGLVNRMLALISFGHWDSIDFLRAPGYAFAAIIATSVWQGVGFQMVIVLAALQNIPGYLYEAAKLDGATSWQQFVHVTLPQIRLTLTFVALVTTILAFRIFDQVRIMTQGGPNDATTTVIYEAVSAAFERQQIARGAAMTVLFFVIVLLLSLWQRKATAAAEERA